MTDFDALYRKYAPDVFRFALYLAGERSEAEDITSETFVRVWTSNQPIEMLTVRGYLFTIARNLFLQGLRKRSRDVTLDETLHGPIRESRPSPLDEIERQGEVRAVLRKLQRLPEADRAAVVMRAQHGMPYEEIARALDISVSAAKVKVHRARLRLADIGRG